MIKNATLLVVTLLVASCFGRGSVRPSGEDEAFVNPIFQSGSSPYLIFHNGHYYYTQTMNDHISIWTADRLAEISKSSEHVIFSPGDVYHISAPQLHRIDGKWYLYFSSDAGTGSDVRHIYVMENPEDDPLSGSFKMIGWINTGNAKDIHPTTFSHKGKRYLLWSGTESTIPGDISKWSIYIAGMSNPWTLDTPKVIISSPEYEWECQWIDEDGTSTSSPVYVNEGPAFLYSRDSTRLLVYYAASETYTSYYCEGLLIASSDADPLSPSSWHKQSEPVFSKSEETGVLGPGHLCFFQKDGSLFILYNGKSRFSDMHAVDNRSCRMQPASWGADGIPILGYPIGI